MIKFSETFTWEYDKDECEYFEYLDYNKITLLFSCTPESTKLHDDSFFEKGKKYKVTIEEV